MKTDKYFLLSDDYEEDVNKRDYFLENPDGIRMPITRERAVWLIKHSPALRMEFNHEGKYKRLEVFP